MLKKLISRRQPPENKRTSAEADEINEIGERLFRKLETGIRRLEEIEKRIDRKVEQLELLIKKAEAAAASGHSNPSDLRGREIMAMLAKGLSVDEIARVLDLPRGEVELIVSLLK